MHRHIWLRRFLQGLIATAHSGWALPRLVKVSDIPGALDAKVYDVRGFPVVVKGNLVLILSIRAACGEFHTPSAPL
jgi:hypothetical protein